MQGERKDDDIQHDVEGRAQPPLEMDVVAAAQVIRLELQPGVVDGPALEERGEEEGGGVGQGKADCDPDCLPEAIVLEDAVEEEENGDLVHCLGKEVEELAEEVELWQEAASVSRCSS